MGQDNHGKAVGCVVIRGEQVLLVRHTYGSAKGKLLIPGGYVQVAEMPEDAAMRTPDRRQRKQPGGVS